MNNLPVIKSDNAVLPITPHEQVAQASEMARLLKDVVSKAGLARKLGGRKEHLEFEAWQTIAKWHGCTVSTEWTRPLRDGDKIIGWEARVNVLDGDGRVIGSSEGMCMSDEPNWRGKPSYALRSMAQTRTAGKALRSLFAHIAVLAGYSPTPAEEMDGIEVKPEKEDFKREAPATAPSAPKTDTPADAATERQRKALFAKGMARWNDRNRVKAFADWCRGSEPYFTKESIAIVLDNFDSHAELFESDR